MKNKTGLIVPIIFAVIAVLLFCIPVIQSNNRPLDTDATADGYRYVKEQESKNPQDALNAINTAKINAGITTETAETPTESQTESVESIASEDNSQQQAEFEAKVFSLVDQINTLNIMPLSAEEIADLKGRFANTVVVGDSMAQAILEYDLLDENHVKYERGASIAGLDEYINEALAMLPQNLIFYTGLNDTDYFDDPYQFAEVYRQKCEYVRSVRPDIGIYVCSMLPPSDELAAEREDLARAPLYDQALMEMCAANGYGYLENKWMVRQELYIEDGIHFNYEFYEIWMQYTALCLQL